MILIAKKNNNSVDIIDKSGCVKWQSSKQGGLRDHVGTVRVHWFYFLSRVLFKVKFGNICGSGIGGMS